MNDQQSQTDRPALSIVIPCHNRADLLRRCLATVMRHRPANSEVLVVDDASPFGSATKTAGEFAGVRAIQLSNRRGFCVAVNRGIAEARAPIVELLNDDTEVEAGWADTALEGFKDPTVVAVAPLVLKLNGKQIAEIDSAGDAYHIGGFAQKRSHGVFLNANSPVRCSVFGASGSSAFYRAESLRLIGGFPESFGSYFEDVDVSFRLRRAGGEIVFEPRSRVWHRVNASYGPPNWRLVEQQSRNEERVYWRNLTGQEIRHSMPLHIAVLAGKAWRRWREGRLFPFVMGRLRAAAEFRDLLRHRRLLAQLGQPDAASSALDRGWRIPS